MKVFIVEKGEYDYSPTLGVFSTEEKAKEFIKKQKEDKNRTSDYDILEYELDGSVE